MKKKGLVIVLLLLGLMVPAALIFAQQGSGNERQHGKHQHEGMHMMKGLDLNDEQKSQIKEIHLGVQKQILPIQNQLNENRARMRTLTTAESPNMKEINSLIDQSSGLRADIQKARAAAHQDVRALLTEDQRVQFDSRSAMSRRGQGHMKRNMMRRHHGEQPEREERNRE